MAYFQFKKLVKFCRNVQRLAGIQVDGGIVLTIDNITRHLEANLARYFPDTSWVNPFMVKWRHCSGIEHRFREYHVAIVSPQTVD
jgi:hypothetical protein